MLDTIAYLPTAVQLIDPGGNKETVYTFGKMKINDNGGISRFWKENPYQPNLRGYKWVVKKAEQKVAEAPKPNQPVGAPRLINFKYSDAEKLVTRAGYQLKVFRGQPATNPNLKWVVYKQNPAPNTPLKKGQVINIMVYDAPKAGAAPAAQPKAPAAPQNAAVVPDVKKLFFKDAQAKLQAAGFVPKLRPGTPVKDAKLHYQVYEQTPAATTALKKGSIVIITVYDDPARTQK